ncbi:MAG: protein kinase [Solirubrobacterales bacterium]
MAASLGNGERFGDFEILEEAGRGGMGVVYRARQISLRRFVALKVIAPQVSDQPDFRSRFERESHLAASIDHPNVVSVHAAGEIDGLSYIAMQWIEGTNLAEAIENGPLPLERVAAIGEQMCGALDAAHATGLTHRDIKPGNILLRRLGRRDHAYLTDFGIAKRAEAAEGTELTQAGSVVGTINYMAPEQIQGHAVASSDLYSLGCVLFEAATGKRPFERESEVATMWAQMNAPRPRPSEVRSGLSPQFDEVMQRALAVEPADRYADGAEFAEALRRAAAGVPLPPPTERIAPATERAVPPPPPPTVPLPPAGPTRDDPRPELRTAQLPPDEAGDAGDGGDRGDHGGPSRGLIKGGIVTLVLIVGAVAALALGGGDDNGGGSGPSTTTTTTTTTTPDDDNSGGQSVADARSEIETLLHSYEDAYSNADIDAMGALLTDDVIRFGVVSGGCAERKGKDAVLAAYDEQFQVNGPLDYSLTGLTPEAITVRGAVGTSNLGYRIGGGSTGTIDFQFARRDDAWLIQRINASCG